MWLKISGSLKVIFWIIIDGSIKEALLLINISFAANFPRIFVELTAIEYDKGTFLRFFLRKSNDKNAPIVEVEEAEFRAFLKNPFYIRTTLVWKIRGSLESIVNDGILIEKGISDHNYEQVTSADAIIPGISNKLKDLFEFYKAD